MNPYEPRSVESVKFLVPLAPLVPTTSLTGVPELCLLFCLESASLFISYWMKPKRSGEMTQLFKARFTTKNIGDSV